MEDLKKLRLSREGLHYLDVIGQYLFFASRYFCDCWTECTVNLFTSQGFFADDSSKFWVMIVSRQFLPNVECFAILLTWIWTPFCRLTSSSRIRVDSVCKIVCEEVFFLRALRTMELLIRSQSQLILCITAKGELC